MKSPLPLTLSIVLPCRNEEEALPGCLAEAAAAIRGLSCDAEIIVVDNGSTDGSRKILEESRARYPELVVLEESLPGYGSAYARGLSAARGDAIILADCDGTYPLADVPRFLRALEGADVVIGNRFANGLPEGTMPWLHRHVGNPFLSFLVRRFFSVRLGDIHCGVRAVSRAALGRLNLRTTGMEFASEMVIKAAKQGLRLAEIPITYRPRIGESKLRSFHDGWRHLRFILLYSPTVLFFAPGLAAFTIGATFLVTMLVSSPTVFGVQLQVHPIFLASLLVTVGYQLMIFAGFARVYAVNHLGDRDPAVERLYRVLTLEKAAIAGAALAAAGVAIYLDVFAGWVRSGFGSLDAIKSAVAGLTLVTIGVQTFFSAFVFSVLGIEERR